MAPPPGTVLSRDNNALVGGCVGVFQMGLNSNYSVRLKAGDSANEPKLGVRQEWPRKEENQEDWLQKSQKAQKINVINSLAGYKTDLFSESKLTIVLLCFPFVHFEAIPLSYFLRSFLSHS
jgi:hypothetical protein